jgi:cytochrome c peroxidase
VQRFPAAGKPKAANAVDGPWEGMTAADQKIVNTIFVNFGKALQAYMRKLVSRNAPFDRLVAGNATSLSSDAVAGLKIFLGKANCVSCHSGPHFTDNAFHTLGVAQTGPNVPAADLGRFTDITALLASPFNSSGVYSDDVNTGRLTNLVATDANKGQFRTPSLRGIAATGPYMHAGQFQTLDQVIDFYDAGNATPLAGTLDAKIKPLGLTAKEKQQLAAFLQTLSGDAVPAALLVDTVN